MARFERRILWSLNAASIPVLAFLMVFWAMRGQWGTEPLLALAIAGNALAVRVGWRFAWGRGVGP